MRAVRSGNCDTGSHMIKLNFMMLRCSRGELLIFEQFAAELDFAHVVPAGLNKHGQASALPGHQLVADCRRVDMARALVPYFERQWSGRQLVDFELAVGVAECGVGMLRDEQVATQLR